MVSFAKETGMEKQWPSSEFNYISAANKKKKP